MPNNKRQHEEQSKRTGDFTRMRTEHTTSHTTASSQSSSFHTSQFSEQESASVDQGYRGDSPGQQEVETNRIEAFSDGVFAIAITLLILDIHVPSGPIPSGEGTTWLLGQLVHQWPNYLSFFLSFLIVGVVWGNHHTMFSYIKRSNHFLIILNLLLLLSVVVIAFTAALLGHYLGTAGQQAAVMVYSGVLVIGGIFYNLLWWYASQNYRLIDRMLPPEVVRRVTRRYVFGPILYTLAFALSFFWNGTPGLILCILLALIYLLPTVADRIRPPTRREVPTDAR